MDKTYEELRSMTHEDLVRTVLELQEEYSCKVKESNAWRDKYHTANNAIETAREQLNNTLKFVL